MTIGSKEHDDIIKSFEKVFYQLRLEKEEKELWRKGLVYQSGETNSLYKAFIHGYSEGRINYM